ncbi:hypothetical protein WOLCODRAFT_127783 [Wolfiporia cocos MD-104 SS10]|uniref:F-box domain-containing protein n=1 Tax=Wolfiporia cocos (strain MD-104) TaxID=742152 RepID=A0A2H3JGP8_WOLCO|nr:hypothetical protein WOLCODRAFT_127783 [Wolfiporia cocos MD-104 SS10]
MVSADNLNLDCLEIIFALLHESDLVSVSLVSRSFLAGVIPRLYRTLAFKVNQTKRYPSIISPFASVVAHPNLASHVRNIDLRAVPLSRVKTHPQPEFISDCLKTIALCRNLVSFVCTPNVLPSFLAGLREKSSLQHLRFNGTLIAKQATMLLDVPPLKSMVVETGSLDFVNVLPRWAARLKPSLTNLTLCHLKDLNDCVLESTLSQLPRLTGLHIMGCPRIDHHSVLRLTSHTPNLESLAFTCWESARPLETPRSTLPRLKHLCVDTHRTMATFETPPSWSNFIDITRSWSCKLTSVVFKLPEKWLIGEEFVEMLVDAHGSNLTRIALLNCVISSESIERICKRCARLEYLAISIPKDILPFVADLSHSKSLHTLSDASDAHSAKSVLSKREVESIMRKVPSLWRIVSDDRIWTVERGAYCQVDRGIDLEHERKKPPSIPWFMPPSTLASLY